jgi:cell division septum initiation protein DivIVA
MCDRWGAPVVCTSGAIHRDSGCVSAGVQHNSPGQHRLGAGTACRAGAQSVTSVTALQTLKLQHPYVRQTGSVVWSRAARASPSGSTALFVVCGEAVVANRIAFLCTRIVRWHQSVGGTLTTEEHGASAGDGTSAAARLLEIATRNADELIGEARAEAASIVAMAQTDADRLTESSQAQAEQLTASARAEVDRVLAAAHADAARVHAELEQTRAEQNAELDRHRTTVLADLAKRQAALEAEVARLQQLEQEYRNRMRSYLTQQLAQIESNPHPELRHTPSPALSQQRTGP